MTADAAMASGIPAPAVILVAAVVFLAVFVTQFRAAPRTRPCHRCGYTPRRPRLRRLRAWRGGHTTGALVDPPPMAINASPDYIAGPRASGRHRATTRY